MQKTKMIAGLMRLAKANSLQNSKRRSSWLMQEANGDYPMEPLSRIKCMNLVRDARLSSKFFI
jgi:hypothetical protein